MTALTAGVHRSGAPADLEPGGPPAARTTGPARGDHPATVSSGTRAVRSWPLLVLAAPAAAEVWSGWVGIAQKTGFGLVSPLSGIWPSLHLDTSITLPVGVEAYAAYALRAWLADEQSISGRTRRFAKWSAICSFALGMAGHVAYHLLAQAGAARAPWPVTTIVSCLPVLVLAMGTALAHMLRADADTAADGPDNWTGRPAVSRAVEATGKDAKRKGGKLPPHVMVYFAMALALFAEEDYEETWVRLAETLAEWGCWDRSQGTVTTGGLTQARQRLGHEPVREVFAQVVRPVATEDTPGAFLGPWRKMSMDGLEWDIPDTKPNAAAFGYPGTGKDAAPAAFPKARAVTIGECASHAPVLAAIGPCVSKGSGEQSLARQLYPQLREDWLLIADRNFYNWQDWCTAADTGAALLWREFAGLPGRMSMWLSRLPPGSPPAVGQPGE